MIHELTHVWQYFERAPRPPARVASSDTTSTRTTIARQETTLVTTTATVDSTTTETQVPGKDSGLKETTATLSAETTAETRLPGEETELKESVQPPKLPGGKAPGGLTEGIADYIRLSAKLAPSHWKDKKTGDWDAGYDTTAYFLQWIERENPNFVRKLNLSIGMSGWDVQVFAQVTGKSVEELWELYSKAYCRN